MNRRVALVVVLIGVVIVSTAALRGCQDPTKPIPWVSGDRASVRDSFAGNTLMRRATAQ